MHPTDPNWNPNHSDWWPAKRGELFRKNFDSIKWDKDPKVEGSEKLDIKNSKQ